MIKFEQVKYVLMDIEGTLSEISFVHNVLFPYAEKMIPNFMRENEGEVSQIISDVQKTVQDERSETLDLEGVIAQLLNWIADDRKHLALKNVQGRVWKRGFTEKVFQAPLYADVAPAWRAWSDRGLKLGIYSSGSNAAQKLFFAHTTDGDLLSFLSDHFDLSNGPKKEPKSYEKISRSLGVAASATLFFSDVGEELDAAKLAGLQTCQTLREGIEPCERHAQVRSFDEIDLG